jgi:chemotaxis protein methyltransferase CheR
MALVQDLTVAETYFFRNMDQFRAFSDVALPDRWRHAQREGRRLQIVSAGCATGEEPYSLAITARDSVARASDVSITAVDINPLVLERARRGRYSSWALRDTRPEVQRRWFRKDGRDFAIDDSIRAAVTFEPCNLADEQASLWTVEKYDVIFCRNVLMYFTPATTHAVTERLARSLRPGGYLFLGHAETLRGLSNDFHLRHTHDTFYYQRKATIGATRPFIAAAPRHSQAASVEIVDVVDASDSWVDAIRRASQRIEVLATSPRPPVAAHTPPRPAAAVKPAWDIGLAIELLRQERFADALKLVNALPPESARDADVLLLNAVLLTHSSAFGEAERVCQRLLEVDEMNAGAHYLLALCREGAADRSGAVQHDQVAVYLDPAFAMPHLHLGLLARRSGDHATARRELGQALTLLQREDASRLLLFGGGFGRETLTALCRSELAASGGQP